MQVFGVVAEGEEVLMKINEAFVDEKNRPFKNIRWVSNYFKCFKFGGYVGIVLIFSFS